MDDQRTESILRIATTEEILGLFGPRDQNLRVLRSYFQVAITSRNGRIRIAGPTRDVQQATRVMEQLRQRLRSAGTVTPAEVQAAAEAEVAPVFSDPNHAADQQSSRRTGANYSSRSVSQSAFPPSDDRVIPNNGGAINVSDGGWDQLSGRGPAATDSNASQGIPVFDLDQPTTQRTGNTDRRPRQSARPKSYSPRASDSRAAQLPNFDHDRGGGEIHVQHAGRKIVPRTEGQARYVSAIRKYDLTFATGPAGCGKTYLAVATAVEAFKEGAINKIVL
ncbi:MAG: PhoH family protein, partial [Planctomycetota bacterium]